MRTVDEVLGLIKQAIRPLPEERVALEAADGRVLARGVRMDMDAPPFDRSMRDGYALRAADATTGSRLEIVGRQDAGMESGAIVKAGTCVAINTGAAIPAGADAVVMVEETKLTPGGNPGVWAAQKAGISDKAGDSGTVEFLKPAVPGMNIQKRGSDAAAGEDVLEVGLRMTPAAMAVAASAGAAEVWVRRAVRVAVLTTGDEVVAVERTPGANQIRNSNGPMLGALAQRAGAEVIDLGIARDEKEEIRRAVRRGLAEADVLVVTGGMSMGTKDLVPEVLVEEGVEVLVETVKMKPGKPFLFGRTKAGKFVVGLPGNPVSGFVCFVRFVGPMLRAMMGGRFETELEQAISDEALDANESREFYQPGVVRMEGGGWRVKPLAWRGSADVYTLSRANALIVHEARTGRREAGAKVVVLQFS